MDKRINGVVGGADKEEDTQKERWGFFFVRILSLRMRLCFVEAS
jgi:hypothetical protein